MLKDGRVLRSSRQPLIIGGRETYLNNLIAAQIVAEAVKPSLGPYGLDKMFIDSAGVATITNDGAVFLKEMKTSAMHPIVKIMAEMAQDTDKEVGDGTKTVIVLSGELLKRALQLFHKGVHPSIIVEGYIDASRLALDFLEELAIPIKPEDEVLLKKVAATALSGRLQEDRWRIAEIATEAVLTVKEKLGKWYKVDLDNIRIMRMSGGSLNDSMMIKGIAFNKGAADPHMPKRIKDAKVALIAGRLKIISVKLDGRLIITTPQDWHGFLNEEKRILKEWADRIIKSGASVVLCQKEIDNVIAQQLAEHGILAIEKVSETDLYRASRALNGSPVKVEELTSKDLGFAKRVEERVVSNERWFFFEGCYNPKSVTVILRGAAEHLITEAERFFHDALSVVKNVVVNPKVVIGGGAIEAKIASLLKKEARKVGERTQLSILAFAEAIETIPIILAKNAGMNPLDTLLKLRSYVESKNGWYGINAEKRKVEELSEEGVYDPLSVKKQVIKSATEAAVSIIRINEILAARKKGT